MARPIVWTDDKKEEAVKHILLQLATSELGLEHICNAEEWLPSASTFHEWRAGDKVLAERYARAREEQAVYMADTAGVIGTQLVAKNPSYSVDPQAYRAYLDGVKWRASKLAPKTFGEKQQVEHTGKDGGPIKTEAVYKELSVDELKKLAALGTES
ncbi:hypothetical protein EBZ38_03870 [bacterium]|nr:hypothetical protein [bacterium]